PTRKQPGIAGLFNSASLFFTRCYLNSDSTSIPVSASARSAWVVDGSPGGQIVDESFNQLVDKIIAEIRDQV
ncbi:MAG: hypothetical protein ABFS17_11820, partial [Chloroflexota bacterium]